MLINILLLGISLAKERQIVEPQLHQIEKPFVSQSVSAAILQASEGRPWCSSPPRLSHAIWCYSYFHR